MPTNNAITNAFDAMPFNSRFLDLALWVSVLKAELKCGSALKPEETIALAKKILCRALNAEYTKAEVEAFLKG